MKKEYVFYFIVGTQDLYGPEVLKTVAERAGEMASELSACLPRPLIFAGAASTDGEICDMIGRAKTTLEKLPGE